MSYTNTAKCR